LGVFPELHQHAMPSIVYHSLPEVSTLNEVGREDTKHITKERQKPNKEKKSRTQQLCVNLESSFCNLFILCICFHLPFVSEFTSCPEQFSSLFQSVPSCSCMNTVSN
jgi:hypothetical protein